MDFLLMYSAYLTSLSKESFQESTFIIKCSSLEPMTKLIFDYNAQRRLSRYYQVLNEDSGHWRITIFVATIYFPKQMQVARPKNNIAL